MDIAGPFISLRKIHFLLSLKKTKIPSPVGIVACCLLKNEKSGLDFRERQMIFLSSTVFRASPERIKYPIQWETGFLWSQGGLGVKQSSYLCPAAKLTMHGEIPPLPFGSYRL
jgi:hypothetical protein